MEKKLTQLYIEKKEKIAKGLPIESSILQPFHICNLFDESFDCNYDEYIKILGSHIFEMVLYNFFNHDDLLYSKVFFVDIRKAQSFIDAISTKYKDNYFLSVHKRESKRGNFVFPKFTLLELIREFKTEKKKRSRDLPNKLKVNKNISIIRDQSSQSFFCYVISTPSYIEKKI